MLSLSVRVCLAQVYACLSTYLHLRHFHDYDTTMYYQVTQWIVIGNLYENESIKFSQIGSLIVSLYSMIIIQGRCGIQIAGYSYNITSH